ncbi:MAG: ATP-grasp domain-containing protein [Clostridia bacterium]|nr:ATP-grasp domain-containing protein [Clostridia bacterium]
MKKIAIIGANEFQNPLILKAKQMGFETHVFAWAAGDIGEKTADFFYPISIIEGDVILQKCREIGICAICSIGSDLAVHTVNHVARAMGFPCNSERCDRVATDKYHMRTAFMQANIPTPKFALAGQDFSLDAIEGFTFPMIVKPTDRSGSRGITKVEAPEEILPAVKAAQAQSFGKEAIIEEFVYGEEYSCECISFAGRHEMLAITKKYTTEAPHFIECGHVEPSDIPVRFIPMIRETVFRAMDALDIRYGASHPEFRLTPEGELRLIEIGARMGGDCIGSDLVEISTGYDFTRMVIDVACGNPPDLTPVKKPERAAVWFVFDHEDAARMRRALAETPELIWRASELHEIEDNAVTDSSNRFGYYITATPFDR